MKEHVYEKSLVKNAIFSIKNEQNDIFRLDAKRLCAIITYDRFNDVDIAASRNFTSFRRGHVLMYE